MRHTVYTRCKYNSTADVIARLELTKRYTVPSMNASQHEHPIVWCWTCHEAHKGLILSTLREASYTGMVMFNKRDDTEDLQTALDSDDLFTSTWLKEAQELWKGRGKPFIRYWHPIRYATKNGKWYRPWRIANWPSMFYTVYNPTPEVHVYCEKHTKLNTTLSCPVRPVDTLNQVALVVHGANMHTVIKPKDVEIPRPAGYP